MVSIQQDKAFHNIEASLMETICNSKGCIVMLLTTINRKYLVSMLIQFSYHSEWVEFPDPIIFYFTMEITTT